MAGRIADNFVAALTGHSGASRPSYAEAGTIWQDTSLANTVRFYLFDGTDDILVYTVDTENNRIFMAPQPFVDVAGAGTTDVGAATSSNVRITGTGATITSLGNAPVGTVRDVLFSGAHTMTHNATSLILQNGGSNIATAAGDTMRFVSLGSGNWRQTDWQRSAPVSITRSNAISASSQTSMDFTGIPAGVRKITIGIVGLSTNGTDPILVQLGDGGGVETSGYLGAASNVVTTVTSANYTVGFGLHPSLAAANIYHGIATLINISGNDWALSGVTARSDGASTSLFGGSKSLSDTLDRLRITTTGGTNTFDAGSVNIMWEF
jgi:hypothetical protein